MRTLLECTNGSPLTMLLLSCMNPLTTIIMPFPPHTKQIRYFDIVNSLCADTQKFPKVNPGLLPLLCGLIINLFRG